jgi:hypothetical protein
MDISVLRHWGCGGRDVQAFGSAGVIGPQPARWMGGVLGFSLFPLAWADRGAELRGSVRGFCGDACGLIGVSWTSGSVANCQRRQCGRIPPFLGLTFEPTWAAMLPPPCYDCSVTNGDTKEGRGVWYEKFVADVYQCLVSQDAITNVSVQHNATLIGRSGASHQIDVYWEFVLAGARYVTCIECKAYSSTVKKAQVAAFSAILEDIGNANGIFVTTMGYQKGAKQLASHRHIRLVTLNPVINRVVTQMKVQIPEYQNVRFTPDIQGAKPLLAAACLASLDVDVQGTGDSLKLVDADGNHRVSLVEFLRCYPIVEGEHTVAAQGYYLPSKIGPLPLSEVIYDLVMHTHEQTISVEAPEVIKGILQDVLGNTTQYVKDMRDKHEGGDASS